MKRYHQIAALMTAAFLLTAGNLSAQQVMQMEYFFDSIPAGTQGNILTVTPGDTAQGTFTINTAGLDYGKHLLIIRARDTNGIPGFYLQSWFVVDSVIPYTQIDSWEWFTSVDPGPGQGTVVPVQATDTLSILPSLKLDTLPAGKHNFYIRARGTNGAWSTYLRQTVLFDTYNPTQLTGWEWFANTDPGTGAGVLLPLANLDSFQALPTLVTDTLPPGRNVLYVRTLASNGAWSHYMHYAQWLDRPDTTWNVTELEYFIGPEPGLGAGTSVAVGPADTIDQDITAQTDTLSLGNHILNIRAKNDLGTWSHVLRQPFAICTMFGPKADFDWKVERNQVYFINQSEYLQQAEWAFGNGSSDTLQLNPAHTYIPGVYQVCMIAKNVCGRDTVCKEVVVRGVARITPSVHANEGVLVSDIYGGGLDSGSTVRLVKDGVPDIVATNPNFLDHTHYRPVFKFRGDPVGTYHLVVDAPVSGSDTLYNAITLEPATGHDLWVELAGPSRLLINRKISMTLIIGNKGNQTAYAVPFYINAPVNSNLEVKGNYYQDSLPQAVYDSMPYFSIFEDSIMLDTSMYGAFVMNFIRPGEIRSFTFSYQPTVIGKDEILVYLSNPLMEDWQLDSIFRSSCSVLPPCSQCLLDLMGLIPGVGCVTGIFDLGCAIAENIKGKQGGWTGVSTLLGSLGGAMLSCTPAGSAKTAYKIAKELAGAGSGAGSAIPTCLAAMGPGGCKPKPKKPKPTNTVASLDPNIKVGPVGISEENYTRGDHPFVYSIYFENADTASAPASEVWVIDTLDKALFDLSTLQFISFGFGDTSVTVLESIDPAAFVRDIDLRPVRNTIVRVQGSLDTATGVLTAYYASYDPDTMRLVYDPFDGFLPPNVNAPEGEGFIQFLIALKPGIQHLDRIENEAAIYFDANAPIVTPVWLNTIDLEAPTSAVDALPAEVFDTSFTVSWSGTDAHAGVMDYDIYVIEDDTLEYLWKNGIRKTTATFTGHYGRTYKFYSVARDNAGNEELPPNDPVLMPDAFTTLKPTGIHRPAPGEVAANLYPNPANQSVQVEIELLQPEALSIRISHLHGTVVDERHLGTASPGVHRSTFNLVAYPAGVYLVEVHAGERQKVLKLVVNR